MPRPRGGRSIGRTIGLAAAALVVLGAFLLFPRPPQVPQATRPAPSASPALRSGPALALVIDDVGSDADLAERLLLLPVPLTLAVLPRLPHSRDYGGAAARGKEVVLHLPMEPEGYPGVDPGPGALLTGMGSSAILSTFAEDLAGVPGAVGVNNHMGSRFTAREPGMETLLAALGSRGLFFLDSRTTAATVAVAVATRVGAPVVSRDIFLDGDEDPGLISRRWREAVRLAETRGHAVVIGHLRPATVAFVEERVRAADWGKATPVTLSTLLQRIVRAGSRA